MAAITVATVLEVGSAVIQEILQLMNDTASGKITPDEALAQIQTVKSDNASADAAAKAAEDAKFGKEPA